MVAILDFMAVAKVDLYDLKTLTSSNAMKNCTHIKDIFIFTQMFLVLLHNTFFEERKCYELSHCCTLKFYIMIH